MFWVNLGAQQTFICLNSTIKTIGKDPICSKLTIKPPEISEKKTIRFKQFGWCFKLNFMPNKKLLIQSQQ